MLSICIPHLPFSAEINTIMDEALKRYQEHATVPYEICLVVNGGEYDPPELDIPLKISKHTQPLGNPGGWNAAYDLSEGDVIAFMDSDVWVEPGWDAPLLDSLDDEVIGLVMPVIHRREPDGHYTVVADNAQGCALIMRRDVLDWLSEGPLPDERVPLCRGFDERFNPAYCEDTDLFLRLKLSGWRRRVEHKSHVLHLNGSTTHKYFKDYEAVAANSRERFELKWKHLGKKFGRPNCWNLWL